MRGTIITGRSVALLALGLAAGCSKGTVQPISGQVALQSFDATVTSVRAVRPGAAPIVARVGLDGRFEIQIPRGRHYHLEFTGPSGAPVLVYPRATAPLGWTFDVRGPGSRFDVGTVRYLGDPMGRSYTFVTRQGQTVVDADAGPPVDDQCEDGKDVRTGAACVDDDDGDKKENECDDDSGDDDDCVNGVVPKTGAPCMPASAPGTAAVADHNLPPVMGACADDDDGEKDDD